MLIKMERYQIVVMEKIRVNSFVLEKKEKENDKETRIIYLLNLKKERLSHLR